MHRFLLAFILIIVPSGPIFSQPADESLSLEDCIRLAQNAQSPIGIAQKESEIADYGVDGARAAFFPQARLLPLLCKV